MTVTDADAVQYAAPLFLALRQHGKPLSIPPAKLFLGFVETSVTGAVGGKNLGKLSVSAFSVEIC